MLAFLLSAIAATSTFAQVTNLSFQSSDNRTALLELYASEGCNSCPPAEAWLSRQTNAAGLWTDFVPMAFHVDYWDHLGWRDRWGKPEFSDRQRAYSELFRSRTIYTPEFILNGHEWRRWTDVNQVPQTKTKTGVLVVTPGASNLWQVQFTPKNPATAYELHAAHLVCGVSSDVTAGENDGHHLAHDFVALALVNGRLEKQDTGFKGTFAFAPFDLPRGSRAAFAVWVTREGQLEAEQATGGWLPAPH